MSQEPGKSRRKRKNRSGRRDIWRRRGRGRKKGTNSSDILYSVLMKQYQRFELCLSTSSGMASSIMATSISYSSSFNFFSSFIMSSCLSLTSLCISLFTFTPKNKREIAKILKKVTTIVLSVFTLFYGDTISFMVSVGNFFSMNFAIDMLLSFEKANSFFTSYEAVMQKLVRARKAKPSSNIDLSPPIILNHSSTTFFPFRYFCSGCLGSSG